MEIKLVNLWKATASRGFDLQAMGSSMFTPSTVANPPAGLALEPSYVSSKMCCQRFYIVVCSSQISLYHETISWKLISLSRMLCVLIASPVSVDRQSSPWPCTSLSFFALHLGVSWNGGSPKLVSVLKCCNLAWFGATRLPPWLRKPPCVGHGCCILASKFHGDLADPEANGTGSLGARGEDASSEAKGEDCTAPGWELMSFCQFPYGTQLEISPT
jgi:hypothetical protein